MWLFTKYGFFSAVCARCGRGEHREPIDPGRLSIRARLREHLDALKGRFPDVLGGCEIREFAGTDYAFRFVVDKSVWTQVVANLAEETDYGTFKNAVARHQGLAGAEYHDALHDVWSVMHRLQGQQE
jgi:hypothetical protein